MILEVGKAYKRRDGKRTYCVGQAENGSMILHCEAGLSILAYSNGGQVIGSERESARDIVGPWPKKHKKRVCFYKRESGEIYATNCEVASEWLFGPLVAAKEVEFEEGEGL